VEVARDECPKVGWSGRDPLCTMVKEVARCDVVTPPADCAKERNNKLYLEYTATLETPTCPDNAPAKPATQDITAVFTLAGSVASLTSANKFSIKQAVAKGANVKHSQVTMTYEDGSVVVTAVIATADANAANAASAYLNEGIMKDSSSLVAALAAEGMAGATVESLVAAVQYSPPPPPAAPSSGLETGALVGIIVGSVLGALLLLALLVIMMKKKKAPAGKAVGSANA